MTYHWTPGIGDPTLGGWFTVFAYLTAAAFCTAAAVKAPRVGWQRRISDHAFWLAVAAIFLVLAINKQLDLQSLLTEIGRSVAQLQGWYSERRNYQAAFVTVMGLAGTAVLLSLLWHFRARPTPMKIALCGLAFTCTFVVVRAASFHHVDMLLGIEVLGVRWNWILELTGIGIVAVAARWSLKGTKLDLID